MSKQLTEHDLDNAYRRGRADQHSADAALMDDWSRILSERDDMLRECYAELGSALSRGAKILREEVAAVVYPDGWHVSVASLADTVSTQAELDGYGEAIEALRS